MSGNDTRSLRCIVRTSATNGDEAVTLVVNIHLVSIHAVVVLGVGLNFVVDADRNTGFFKNALHLIDDTGASKSRGNK